MSDNSVLAEREASDIIKEIKTLLNVTSNDAMSWIYTKGFIAVCVRRTGGATEFVRYEIDNNGFLHELNIYTSIAKRDDYIFKLLKTTLPKISHSTILRFMDIEMDTLIEIIQGALRYR